MLYLFALVKAMVSNLQIAILHGRLFKKLIFFGFLTTFSIHATFAQLDSLKKLLPTLSKDTVKVKVLSELVFHYANINKDTATNYATEAYSLSSKLKFPRGLALTLYADGYLNWVNGDIVSCISKSEQCIALGDSLGDTFIRSKALRNIGLAYSDVNEPNTAFEYYRRSIKGFEEIKEWGWSSWVYSTVGFENLEILDLKNAEISLLQSQKQTSIAYPHYYTLQCNIALLRTLQNRLPEADSIIAKVLPAIVKSSNNRVKGYFYFINAKILLAKGVYNTPHFSDR
ncbi:MAG: hypothetical protein ORN54_05560 [Cyclobacteriaceae bacterium]|nr:hypothetical protein [Cyclobacteriaceae bacterium]